MAVLVHDSIRLDVDLADGMPVNEYGVIQGTLEMTPAPALISERSLTGFLQVHRVVQGTTPLVFDNQRHQLLIKGQAELDQLKADLNRTVYFMPHRRDEDAPEGYLTVKLFKALTIEPIDPMLEWFRAAIDLEDATSNVPSDQ